MASSCHEIDHAVFSIKLNYYRYSAEPTKCNRANQTSLCFLAYLLPLSTYLATYFRSVADQLPSFVFDVPNWFFVAKQFITGVAFLSMVARQVSRLPTVVFLIWLSILLTRYLRTKRSFTIGRRGNLVGGTGGLTLDILAFAVFVTGLVFMSPIPQSSPN